MPVEITVCGEFARSMSEFLNRAADIISTTTRSRQHGDRYGKKSFGPLKIGTVMRIITVRQLLVSDFFFEQEETPGSVFSMSVDFISCYIIRMSEMSDMKDDGGN